MLNFLFTKTPLYFLIQSIWRDEAFSYLLAKKNFFEIITLSSKDFTPPLYYLILHFWMKIFESSEIALRSLSFIFYWGTVYLGFLFLENIFKTNIKKAFFYTLLIAINPLLLYYAFEARAYSMFAFFSALSFYAFYQKKSRLYLFSTIAGLYTHYFMLFVVFIQFFYKKSKEQFISLASFLPWLVFVVLNGGFNFQSFWIKKVPLTFKNIVSFIGELYTGYEKDFVFFDKNIFNLSLFLLMIVIWGFFLLKNFKKNEKRLFVYLFIWALFVPFFINIFSFIKPVFLPRYLIFASLGLSLLIIFIIDKSSLILKLIILSILLNFTFNYHKLQIKERKKSDFRKIVKEIDHLSSKNDYIYVLNELDFFPVIYYVDSDKKDNVYIWGKTYEEIPNYVGKVLIPKEKIANSLPNYPQKAFIITPDGNYSIQALY